MRSRSSRPSRTTLAPPRALGSVCARWQHPLVSPGRGLLQSSRLPARSRWQSVRATGSPTAEDDDDRTSGPRRGKRLARLEAVLFLATEPLNSRKLAELAHLEDGTETRSLIRRLNKIYDGDKSAFRVEEVAGGFQLLTRPGFSAWLNQLAGGRAELRLTGPAMETLAVVAYRQPVLRATVESIRGVQCGEVLRQLMDRDLVRIAGRSEELGRPFLYGTTRGFLQAFGLRGLDELPRAELRSAATNSDDTDDKEPLGETGSNVENSNLTNADSGTTTKTTAQESQQGHEESTVTMALKIAGGNPTEAEQTAGALAPVDESADTLAPTVAYDEDEDDEYEYVYEDDDEEYDEDEDEDDEEWDEEEEGDDEEEDEDEDEDDEEDDEEEYEEWEEVDDEDYEEEEDEDDEEWEEEDDDEEEWEEEEEDEDA